MYTFWTFYSDKSTKTLNGRNKLFTPNDAEETGYPPGKSKP